MPNVFRTLRFRLALLYLVVFGVIQTALCIGILSARHRQMHGHFATSLAEKTELIADSLETQPADSVPMALLQSSIFSHCFVQISRDDGTVMHASADLQGIVLPNDDRATEHDPGRDVRILTGPLAERLAGTGARLCIYHAVHPLRDGTNVHVQVAGSLADVDRRFANSLKATIGCLLVALLVSGVASWYVAGRSLIPIARIAHQAGEFVATDLSRRLEVTGAADEIEQLTRVLNQMLDRLERAFRAQEQFIADVSHELKTPLASLIAEAQLLAHPARNGDEQRHFVRHLHQELHRLTRIVDSLLVLTRAESGFPLEDAELVSLNEVVAEAVDQCASQAAHNQVRLATKFCDVNHGDATMLGNADLLCTAVVNLIRNAIRFSPPQHEVCVCVRNDLADFMAISVADAGPGVPPEHLPYIFDRFFRIPHADGERLGMGLGLAIAKAVVELHGGTIEVTNLSKPHADTDGSSGGSHGADGCEFTITLPRSSIL